MITSNRCKRTWNKAKKIIDEGQNNNKSSSVPYNSRKNSFNGRKKSVNKTLK